MGKVTYIDNLVSAMDLFVSKYGVGKIRTKDEIRIFMEEEKFKWSDNLQLTDHCYNRINDSDEMRKRFKNNEILLFHQEGNSFSILGSHYPYNGEVYRYPNNETKKRYLYGIWTDGVFETANQAERDEVLTYEANTEKYYQEIENELANSKLVGEMREQYVKVRVNQGEFRRRLQLRYSKCCLCGAHGKDLLIASHIKPWSKCEPEECLDADNGLLLCPNHDKLFDLNYISFDDDGTIVISDSLDNVDQIFFNVNSSMRITLTERNKQYMKYHRARLK